MLEHYGEALGMRVARKHLVWYLEEASRHFPEEAMATKRAVVRMNAPQEVLAALSAFYVQAAEAEPANPSTKKEAA